MNQAAEAYRAIGAQSAVEGADPYQLVAMLFDGVLSQLATAKGHIARDEIAPRGECISRAMAMIDTLRASLDFNAGNDMVANLEALYDYMNRRLLAANVESNPALLDEVTALVGEIRSAWNAIEPEVHRGG